MICIKHKHLRNGETLQTTAASNLPPFLERYLDYLNTFQQRKISTQVEVCACLEELFQFLAYRREHICDPPSRESIRDLDITRLTIEDAATVTTEELEAYLCFLETVQKNAGSTRTKKYYLMRRFFLYLDMNQQELGISFHNPAQRLRLSGNAPSRSPAILSGTKFTAMVDSMTGTTEARDRLILFLAYSSGIRLEEMIELNMGDLEPGAVKIRNPEAPRTLYLTDKCNAALQTYLVERRIVGGTDEPWKPLLIAYKTGNRLSARAIQKRITKAAHNAQVPDATFQTLRNTAIHNLLRTENTEGAMELAPYFGYRNPKSVCRLTPAAEKRIRSRIYGGGT